MSRRIDFSVTGSLRVVAPIVGGAAASELSNIVRFAFQF